MAAYEVLLLNTSIPQIQAAQAGDTYVVPRDIAFSANTTFSANTANGILYLNASKVASTSSGLTFDGTTATINTLNLTNALGAIYGGTGLTSYTTGDLIYSSATNTLSKLAIGLNTYILTSNGTAPVWAAPSSVVIGTATNLAGGAAGSVPYQSGASTTTFLSIGAANRVMTSTGSAPQWVTSLTGLTGVSSSSITNTSLTANRVVYSTTGGAQTDSAALTFDGTTLATTTVDATNLEVTNIKAKDGTASMTLADTTGNVTVSSAFAANGGVTIGDASGDAFTINSSAVSTPNGLNFDSNTLVIDAANDRVGVGTATPSVKFDVAGTIRSTGTNANLGGTATTGNAQLALTTNARIWTLYTANSSSGLQFRDETAGLERMQITPTGQVNIGGNFTSTNNTLQVTGNAAIGYTTAAPTTGLIVAGNVGIGTDNPGTKLHVDTGAAGYALTIAANLQTSRKYQFGIDSNSNLAIYETAAAAQFLVLSTSGNLGLGVSPGTAFDIGGRGNSTNIQTRILTTNAAGSSTRFQTTVNADTGFVTFASDVGGNGSGRGFAFNVQATQAMTLDADGDLGIGTTSPNSRLHVNDLTANSFRAINVTAGGAGADAGIRLSGAGGNAFRIQQPSAAAGLFFFDETNSATRLTIDSSGNLGLGVTPSAWWSSAKAIQLPGGSVWTDANNLYTSSNSFYNGTNWIYRGSTFATHYDQVSGQHQWFTAPSGTAGNAISFTQAMTLDASGNLGIGTTSVNTRLEVQASAGEIARFSTAAGYRLHVYANASGNAGAGIQAQNTDLRLSAFDAATNIRFFTGNGSTETERMRIDSSGNLGIGQTNPSTWLVNGLGIGSGANDWGATIYTGTASTGYLCFADGATGLDRYRGYISYAHATNAMLFATDAVERARITSGGDFRVKGAGTAGSTDAFQISGSAPADAARLTSGGDFVVGTTSGIGRIGAAFPNVQYGFTASCTSASGTAVFNRFLYNTSTEVGTISSTGSSTAYNTSSDYRLKDNPQPLTGSGAFIDALKPKTWDWKSGGKGVGFIAHEVQAVSPGTVVGEKDAVDADGKPIMQVMEYGSAEFIANIIAELQSLRARVAQLEAK